MPRTNLGAHTYAENDFRTAVNVCRMKCGITSYQLLAEKLSRILPGAKSLSPPKMTRRMKHPYDFTAGELKALVASLKIPPKDVLVFLGYYAKEIAEINL